MQLHACLLGPYAAVSSTECIVKSRYHTASIENVQKPRILFEKKKRCVCVLTYCCGGTSVTTVMIYNERCLDPDTLVTLKSKVDLRQPQVSQ